MASPLRQNLNKLASPMKLSPLFFTKNNVNSSIHNISSRTPSACSLRVENVFKTTAKTPVPRVHLSPPKCHTVRKLELNTGFISPLKECYQNSLIDKAVEEIGVSNEIERDKLTVIDTPRRIALSLHGLNLKKSWKKLGKGSFGTVIQAKYKGEDVAVKIVPKNRHIGLKSLNSMKNEANALKLCHKNIVKVLQIVAAEGEYGLVFMELCSGINLQSMITELSCTINSTQRARYIHDVACALEHCHSNGVLHLDVKPSNIIVCTPGDFCKLCDFGSSQSFTNIECISSGMNTVMYTDPLILQGKLPSEKSDIYSLGITSWQLMACEFPYGGYTLDTIIYMVGCGKLRPRKLQNVEREDHSFIELYKQCWQQDPYKRPSICEIIQELKKMILVTDT